MHKAVYKPQLMKSMILHCMENFDQSSGKMERFKLTEEILEITKLHSSCSVNNFKLGRIAWVKRGQLARDVKSRAQFPS